MKLLLKIVGALILVVVLLAGSAYAWASVSSTRLLTRATDAHSVDFPIPFPADDPDQALSEARARGKYLVDARYACSECHGGDFSGGVMIDAFPIGRLLGPNLTSGAGSVTTGYTPADWDRIVRHGIRRDGRPALMPSIDFQRMSDQKLSDIVAYLTPHPDALGGWTLDQFITAMRDGRRPDGTALQAPMPLMMPYAQRMADVELEALWLFLQSLPPLPSR